MLSRKKPSDVPSTFLKLLFRNCRTALQDCVPLLTSYDALKTHFNWLMDGGISRTIEQNLPQELEHLEMYLR